MTDRPREDRPDELSLLRRRVADLEHALAVERKHVQAAQDSARRAWQLSTWGRLRPSTAETHEPSEAPR